MAQGFTAATLARVLLAAHVELRANEQVLNSLNVFPIPDGDTGTNLRVTFDAALEAVSRAEDVSVAPDDVLTALTRGAQGNSGVIMAEYVRGFLRGLGLLSSDPSAEFDGDALVRAFVAGDAAARDAVADPVEGTMLTVARAAAEAAETMGATSRAAGVKSDIVRVAQEAGDAARAAVSRSSEQLPVLADSGVVDAGGAGLALVLECLARVVAGRSGLPRAQARPWLVGRKPSAMLAAGGCRIAATGPAFEVVSIVEGLSEAQAVTLRRALADVGDSVVVAGGAQIHRVHVHTDAVLAAITVMREAGRLAQPVVTRFEGPVEALGAVLVICRDEAVRSWAGALGAREAACAGRASAEAARAGDRVLADAPGHEGAVTDSLVGLLAEIDRIVIGDLGESVEVLQAHSWRAARDLVELHVPDSEHVTVCLAPDADLTRGAKLFDRIGDIVGGDSVQLLRLDAGALVQLGVHHG